MVLLELMELMELLGDGGVPYIFNIQCSSNTSLQQVCSVLDLCSLGGWIQKNSDNQPPAGGGSFKQHRTTSTSSAIVMLLATQP